MIDDEQPAIGRDHNLPPGLLTLEQAILSLRELLNEKEQEGGKTFLQRRDEFLRSARNAVVRDRSGAGAAADVIKLAARVKDKIDALRLERSNPYRDVANALGHEVERFWEDVTTEMAGLLGKIDAYTELEDQRVAQQAREQEEEMARLRAAAAPPPVRSIETTVKHDAPDERPVYHPIDPPAEFEGPAESLLQGADYNTVKPAPMLPARRQKIRGDYGATVAQVVEYDYTVDDVRALPDYILEAPGVTLAIIAAVKSTVKALGMPKSGISRTAITGNRIK